MQNDPVIILSINSDPKDIGDAVLSLLSIVHELLPHPKRNEYKLVRSPLAEAAKVKSLYEFEKETRQCFIGVKDNQYIISPTKKVGRGFEGLGKDANIKIPVEADSMEIGSNLLKALDMSY